MRDLVKHSKHSNVLAANRMAQHGERGKLSKLRRKRRERADMVAEQARVSLITLTTQTPTLTAGEDDGGGDTCKDAHM